MGRSTPIRAIAAGISDVGRQREHNEDSYAIDDEHGLFVVADGMGGHQAGDVASRLATSTIADFFRTLSGEDVTWPTHFDRTLSDEENRLLTSIGIANRRIFEQSQSTKAHHGMGTTVVGAHFSLKKLKMFVGHVGDSRAYRVREGKIQQLTRDHSLQNEPFPDLTEAERAELPRNVITRALGMQDNVVVDLTSDESKAGDLYILCSDGLSGMIPDEQILQIVVDYLKTLPADKDGQPHLATKNMEELCGKLVQRANDAGGEDNITALAIRIEEAEEAVPSSRRPFTAEPHTTR
ncbi:MAG TPA: PP2C family serine/threonine-protein phosphatase [Polyangiaceae bacterium]|jgi:protein phosphatase|nr:PP2C family serine/threonine-protein phosphatase [Polyangiaceae bacterium]